MNGLDLLLILTTFGMAAAWWRSDGQLQRTRRNLDKARYRIAQDRLRMRQLAAERDRARDHADDAQARYAAAISGERHLHAVQEQA